MSSKLHGKVIGLLSTEISGGGGIQATMRCIKEIICDLAKSSKVKKAHCISLNDKTSDMQFLGGWSKNISYTGAARSKLMLIKHSFFDISENIDILIVGHAALSPIAYFLKIFGLVKKYYVIIYGIEVWKKVSFLQRLGLNNSELIISISNATINEFIRHNNFDADKFILIPLCAENRQIKNKSTFRLNGKFKLLCVARQDSLEKYKGFEDMFEAISILHKENPDIHLNLVGSGNDQNRLLDITLKFGITDKVTFWGYLANNELDAAYSDCDLYVMPSKGEGFGIVFLEAMKHGKACIGGNHGGVPEVILHNKTGYLVDYGNVNQLVKYILKLKLNQRLRADFGKKGMFRVRNIYSQKIFEQKYLALLSR